MTKNINKTGCKKTKVGRFPAGWGGDSLGSCVRSDSPICYGILMPGAHMPGGIPVIKVTNIRNGELRPDQLHRTSPEIDGEYERSRLKPGDLLLSIRGSTGDVAIVPDNLAGANITQDTARIRLRDGVSREYVFYALQGPALQKQIRTHTIGQAVRGVNVGEVRKLKIPLPTVPEQKAIAGVLECWDKTIRGVERKIEKKREIKKGLMQQLLTGTRRLPEFGAAKGAQGRRVEGKNSEGWRGERLGVIAAIRKGRQLNRLDQAETGEYPVLNGGVQPFGYADKWNTAANTICVSEGGNSCGFVSLITTRFWCGGHCYALKEDASQVDKSFLHQQLKFRQAAIMRLRVGSGLPNIQKKALEKFHLKVPRIEEQRAIAAILSSADEEIAGLERKLANLKEQRRFLLNNLVTGAIRLPRFAKRRQGAVKGVRK